MRLPRGAGPLYWDGHCTCVLMAAARKLHCYCTPVKLCPPVHVPPPLPIRYSRNVNGKRWEAFVAAEGLSSLDAADAKPPKAKTVA